MISIVARAAGTEEHLPLLLVGVAELEDGGGRAFHFQCDLRMNEYLAHSNWPEGESYCVSTEHGFTCFGCVSEIEAQGRMFRVAFTNNGVRDLRLDDSEYEFHVAAEDVDMDDILHKIRTILTCGRPEYQPRFNGAWPEGPS